MAQGQGAGFGAIRPRRARAHICCGLANPLNNSDAPAYTPRRRIGYSARHDHADHAGRPCRGDARADFLGGNTWTALLSDNPEVKAALAIWLNSTLGLMLRTCYAQTTQPGRARLQIRGLYGLPVPDFAADNAAGRQARAIAREHIGELTGLQLRPASYAFQDANRRRVDSVALAMVGLGESQQANAAMDALRQQWCREPSVHGGNRAIMRALGLL